MSREENLIAYCGLYCGDCFSYQGKIADLARDLRMELRQSRSGKIAEALSALSLKFLKDTMNVTKC
jgi:hypothetical protein